VYPVEGVEKQQSEPGSVGLVSGKMTYFELEQVSNYLAQHLMSLGVGLGDLVGLSVEQSSWVMVVGMIAIWKAGGAYVALNPTLPGDRLKYMVDKSNPRVVLTLTHLVPTIYAALDTRIHVVDVDGQWKRIQSAHRPLCPHTNIAPNNLAYVLFTSGSTGLPKGVMIEHKGLCSRLIMYANDHLTPADRVAQVSFYTFDTSVLEIFSTLAVGASLYLAPVGAVAGPELAAFYRNNNITNGGILTPTRMVSLRDENFKCVKRIIAAGEQLTSNIVKMFATDARKIFNLYPSIKTKPIAIGNNSLTMKDTDLLKLQ
jgi:non-ribosomal peptide synthetase component F